MLNDNIKYVKFDINTKSKILNIISIYFFATLLILIPIFNLILLNTKRVGAERNPSIITNNKFVAHAMGEIDGALYTNSLEAFHENYKKGYRTFEVDFIFTSDNKLVACHDWDLINGGEPMTFSQFMSTKINNKYTPLDISKVIRLMQKYKDIHIITDTKATDKTTTTDAIQAIVNAANKIDSSTLFRIIPQIYNQDMYRWVTNIYNFNDLIYTLYQSNDTDDEVIDFVAKNSINIVTISENRFNETLVQELIRIRAITYIHTINSVSSFRYYENKGIFGIYSDEILLPAKNQPIQPLFAIIFRSI